MSSHDSQRNYWIKLKVSLLTSEKVDFLMRQKNGAYYVVLYQCLCLKLCNNDGVMGVPISDEIIVPYNPEKILGETKGWFDIDTIRVALEMFKQLGLIYLQENGLYRITNFEDLVGSETNAAERMRITRAKEKAKQLEDRGEQKVNNVRKILDIRDKSIDIREKETTTNKEKVVDGDVESVKQAFGIGYEQAQQLLNGYRVEDLSKGVRFIQSLNLDNVSNIQNYVFASLKRKLEEEPHFLELNKTTEERVVEKLKEKGMNIEDIIPIPKPI